MIIEEITNFFIDPSNDSLFLAVSIGIATGLFSIAPIYYLYYCNKKGDGKNFIERLIMCGVSFNFALFPFALLLLFLVHKCDTMDVNYNTWFLGMAITSLTIILGLSLYFTYKIGKILKQKA